MAVTRVIDSIPEKPRTKDVEILVLGFSRTGTFSLKTALEKLGYNPYHMSVALRSRHLRYWEEALRAKFAGDGQPFSKTDFDKFLGDYDVLEDIPCILFVDELLEAYPNAKVILTNRDVDSWLKSMNKTFFAVTDWKTMPYLAAYDNALWGPYMRMLRIIMTQWGHGDPKSRAAFRQTYIDHYSYVRSRVPQSNLLEFQWEDGWEPLCRFLGKEVPEGDYPRSNDAASTVKIHNFLYWLRIVKLGWKPFGVLVAFGIAMWIGYPRSE